MRFILVLFLVAPILLAFPATQPTAKRNEVIRDAAKGEAKVTLYQERISELQSQDPPQALKLIGQLRKYAENIDSQRGLMLAFYQLGIYHNLTGSYDSVKYYADKCLNMAKPGKLNLASAYGYQLTGTYYWQVGLFDKATASHLKALKIREALKDSAGIAASLASLGGVSLSTNKLDDAKQLLDKALPMAEKAGDQRLTLRILHTLANYYGMRNQYAEALKTDQRALAICSRTNNLRGFSEIYSNMALCYFYQGELDQALAYHYKVLEIDRFFKDEKQIGDTYLNLAQTYLKKNQTTRALSLLTEATRLFQKTDYKYGLKDSYLYQSEAYQAQGDYEQAFQAFRKYNQVSSELLNETNEKNIANLNIQYQTEKKEQQIKNLSQRSMIQKLQLRQRNIFLMITGGVLFIGLVLVYLFYRQRKLAESARLQQVVHRQQQLSAKAILHAEDQERQRIATELHDGIGQILSGALMNLNLLLRKAQLGDAQRKLAEASVDLVAEGYDELRAISHRMVPNSLLKKGFSSAVQDLLDKIDHEVLKTRFEISGEDLRMDIQVETALYRVLQEVVTNVLKHAQASKLTVQLVKDEDGIFLSMEDNGKGFNLHTESGGIGLTNIRSRVEFLGGNLEVDSRPGKGTFISVHLPVSTLEPV